MCRIPPDFPITLPSIQSFQRPTWAYDRLPNGWKFLRRLLFGETHLLITALQRIGDTPLSTDELKQLLQRYDINENVYGVLLYAHEDGTARELATCYQEWEDFTFHEYRRRALEDERSHFQMK